MLITKVKKKIKMSGNLTKKNLGANFLFYFMEKYIAFFGPLHNHIKVVNSLWKPKSPRKR
jgi:hypothetical protein